MIEADFLVDAVLGGGLADVVQNLRPVGDRLRPLPWLERIAHRKHVAVGPDARITEQVPGAADAVAALKNDKTLGRTIVLQVIARADPGQSGADDQHIDMFVRCGGYHRSLKFAVVMAGLRPGHPRLSSSTLKTWMPSTRQHKGGHDEKSYFHSPSFRGASRASEPGISRFPDVQLHIRGLVHPSRLLPTWTMMLLNSGKPWVN